MAKGEWYFTQICCARLDIDARVCLSRVRAQELASSQPALRLRLQRNRGTGRVTGANDGRPSQKAIKRADRKEGRAAASGHTSRLVLPAQAMPMWRNDLFLSLLLGFLLLTIFIPSQTVSPEASMSPPLLKIVRMLEVSEWALFLLLVIRRCNAPVFIQVMATAFCFLLLLVVMVPMLTDSETLGTLRYDRIAKNTLIKLEELHKMNDFDAILAMKDEALQASYILLLPTRSNEHLFDSIFKKQTPAWAAKHAPRSRQAQADAVYSYLGMAYMRLGRQDESIVMHLQQLSIAKEFGGHVEKGHAYGNLGTTYLSKDSEDNTAKAFDAFTNCLVHAKAAGDELSQASTYGNLGIIYYKQGNLKKAKQFCNVHLSMAQKIGDRDGQTRAKSILRLLSRATI